MSNQSLLNIADQIFGIGGILETQFNLPHRDGQHRMARAIAEALETGKTAIPEAGTGTGKTLAYMVLYGIQAKREKDQVLGTPQNRLGQERHYENPVSSRYSEDKEKPDWIPFAVTVHTIALQEQLMGDCELAKAVIKAAGHNVPEIRRISGRTNYFCENSARKLLESQSRSDEEKAAVREVLDEDFEQKRNNPKSYEGLFSQLKSSEQLGWDLKKSVSAHENHCKCKDCNRATAWKKGKEADIIVLNHSLSLFVPYSRIVIDEAHTFEDVVASQKEFKVDMKEMSEKLSGISSRPATGTQLQTEEWARAITNVQFAFIDEVKKEGIHTRGRTGNFFKIPPAVVMADPEGRSRAERDDNLGNALKDLSLAKTALLEQLCNIHGIGMNSEEEEYNFIPGTKEDRMADTIKAITTSAFQLGECLDGEKSEDARWVEIEDTEKEPNYIVFKAMVDMAPILRDIHKDRTVCMTSATMAGVNGLDSFRKAQGIPAENALMVQCPTPFDLESQMTVRVPTNMPSPGKEEQAYQTSLAPAIREAIQATKNIPAERPGGTLVLFTSKASMDQTFEKLEDEFPIIRKQDRDTSKGELINWMKETDGAVLFGVESFWTGIDLPGAALNHLVIARIPFKPSTPKEDKQKEIATRNGENAFMTVDVNHALMTFNQGVGRLLRSVTDVGTVTILDPRVVQSRYGEEFMKGIPRHEDYSIPGLPERTYSSGGYQRNQPARPSVDIGL